MPAFALRQAVPASLAGELRDWIYQAVSKLSDNGKRLMIRLDLVVPEPYVQDYNRARARYEEKLRERARLIQAEAAVAEKAEGHSEKAERQSTSTALIPYAFLQPHAIRYRPRRRTRESGSLPTAPRSS